MPVEDPVEEAEQVAEEANKRGVTLRLLGGVAFRLRSPSTLDDNLRRKYVDIDFVGLRNQRTGIQKIFVERGYAPRTTFNAMNGHKRLIFNDIENQRRVDIFLNVFEMCHKFDFTKRLEIDSLTLPLADLLLTKLQVYEITEREYKDVTAFLKDHNLGEVDNENTINQDYIAKLCAADWGLWKTVSLNLERISNAIPNYMGETQQQFLVKSKIAQLKKRIDEEPKSFAWRVRARVGEKVKWYELPEADREVVDSRPIAEPESSNVKQNTP